MNNTTQDILGQFLGYLMQRDLDNLAALFSNEIDWLIPGDESKAPWLGRRNNRREVTAFYELLWNNTEPVSATVYHTFIDGEETAITGEFSTKMLATGKVVDSLFSIQLTVKEGLIVRYRLLEDSYAVSIALT